MRISPVSNLNFKNNPPKTQKEKEYDAKRYNLIRDHSFTTENLCFLLMADIVVNTAYKIKDKNVQKLMAAASFVLPFIVSSPFMAIDYYRASKLNKEYKSEELKGKSKFEIFKYNWKTLYEDKPNKNQSLSK